MKRKIEIFLLALAMGCASIPDKSTAPTKQAGTAPADSLQSASQAQLDSLQALQRALEAEVARRRHVADSLRALVEYLRSLPDSKAVGE
jgi:hypothetical protein